MDIMLEGVLKMPYEMAMRDELLRLQYYQRALQALEHIESLRTKLAEREWISVADRLPTINEKGNWHISQRCVVIVNKGHEKYEAFANLTEYLDLGAEWSIDGHNGNWHKNVTHWMPLPPINASPNEG